MEIDWNLWIASFSAIAASSAAIATFLGWKENRELRKAQTEPFVDVKLETIDYHISLFRLKITNTGKGGAFNLKIKLKPHKFLDEELKSAAKHAIDIFNNSKFMVDGVNYVAPLDYKNTRYLNFYGIDKEVVTVEEFFKIILVAEVEFNDLNGNFFIHNYVLDISEFQDTYMLGKPFEESVPKSLEKMQKDISEINKYFIKQYQLLEKNFNAQKVEWSEFELQQKLREIQIIKERDRRLGKVKKVYSYKKIDKKLSVQQLRKQMK